MKKSILVLYFFYVIILNPRDAFSKNSDNNDLIKNLEKFVINSRETTGNFSTISFRNWKNEVGKTTIVWTQEETTRYALDAFERKHSSLEIISFSLIFSSKAGGGIECTGVIIHHKEKTQPSLTPLRR